MWTRLGSLPVIFLLIKVISVSTHKVSVVEYMYEYDNGLSAEGNLMRNVKAHVNIIRLLKGKSELVVFPDGSLSPSSGSNAVYLSLPSSSYTAENYKSEALKKLSEAAKLSNIYVVVSIPEVHGKKHYNSFLVFRRNGTVAAKYRKYHLSNWGIDRPEEPEIVYFDTDMGLRFGLIASLDILFPSPALDLIKQGVRYFICPTSWSSRLPFFSGNQIQQSWSWSQDVTLLAAGLNKVLSGQSGSGIFTGRRGHLTKNPVRYIMSNTPTTLVITGGLDPSRSIFEENINEAFNLRSRGFRNRPPPPAFDFSSYTDTESYKADSSQLKLGKTSLNSFTTKLISPDRNCFQQSTGDLEVYRCQIKDELCQGQLCCQFDLTVDYMICGNPCIADMVSSHLVTDNSFYLFRYRMAVLDGVEYPWKGAESLGLQICSVVSCLNSDISSCGEKPSSSRYKPTTFIFQGHTMKSWAQSVSGINITGNFTTNSSTLIMPSLLLGETTENQVNRFGLLSNSFVLESADNKKRLLLPHERRNLAAAAIVNRVFSRDGLPVSASQIIAHSIFTLSCVSIISIYISFKYS